MMLDPYTNENGVLKNKLGIEEYEKLNQAEADIGFIKLISIDSIELDKFDENLVKRIHKHIFEDIFDWAGEYRTVPIVKEELVLPGYSIPYSDYNNISNDLSNKLNELNSIPWQNLDTKEKSMKFARELALIWRVHPFRDGNTRTMLSFAYLYAKEHNFPFDMKTFTDGLSRKYSGGKVVDYSIRDKFALACLDKEFYPEVGHLAKVFENAINAYNSEEVKTLK